jgi:hypothetical protein
MRQRQALMAPTAKTERTATTTATTIATFISASSLSFCQTTAQNSTPKQQKSQPYMTLLLENSLKQKTNRFKLFK